MNRLTRYFIERPTLFWSMMVGIIIAGVLAFRAMPKLEDPAIAVKQAMVIVPYPGASAHEVELNVAQTMEESLRTLPDVKKIKTECSDGMAMITVEFEMTVMMDEIDQYFDMLRRKVADVSSSLPAGTYDPIVMDDMMDVYGIFYALSGDGYDYPELERQAKMVRRQLLSVPGVKRVSIGGTRDETIDITLSKEELSRNGLIPTQIMMALQQAGKPVQAGSKTAGSENLRFAVTEGVETVDDLRQLQVKTPTGGIVRLGDIATIERGLKTPQRNALFVNGSPSISICVAMEKDAVVPNVGEAVDAMMEETLAAMPAGMSVEKIFFQPEKVSRAISSFMLNLVESVIIVIIVLVLFMGWRSGLIVGFGLVLTIALSFPILLQCGTTLQRISLGAFIVAMGMLVDNAVVIMDGILVDRRRGIKDYLYRIGRNTAWPLLGATVIAAATFVGIYLSPDSAGEFAGDLFLVICVSLLVSWFLALVQVPFCASKWLSRKEAKDAPDAGGELLNSPAHRFTRRAINSLMKHRTAVIAGACALLVLCGLGATRVKNMFFPDFDYNQFVIECYFPAQTSPETTQSQLLEMARRVSENPEVERVAVATGAAPARYCLVRPMSQGGDRYGELIIDCKDYEAIMRNIPALRRELREMYPDAYIRVRKYNFSIATSHTIEVEFAGPDPAVLRRLSAQAEEIMRSCPLIDPYSVQNNWNPTAKTVVAHFDPTAALRSGVNRSDVANALLAASDGMPVGVMPDGDKMLIAYLNVRNADGSLIDNPAEIPVWSTFNVRPDGERLTAALLSGNTASVPDEALRAVPLGSVTKSVTLGWDESKVVRLNGRRVIEAECDPNPDDPDATAYKATEAIRAAVDSIPLPPGYSRRWVGEGELQGTATSHLLATMPLTLFIILTILLLLFNSWRKLSLILICFPFVLCGIVPALYFTGTPFTFMAIIGFMGLIGMMVKNSIVLVDEIGRLQHEEGYHPYKAVVEATVSRVRPVLMASLTTIVGMIPLIPDPMYGSLALTIMGGLTMGTIITLLLLPLFYTAIMHIKPTDDEQL